jgi:hypothetical protein
MNLSKYKFIDDAKNSTLEILNLVNFDGDTEFFTKEFINVTAAKTIDVLLKSLPEGKKDYFTTKLNTPAANLTLADEFTKLVTEEALKAEFIQNFKSFMDKLAPSLTQDESKLGQINTIKDSLR